MLKCEDRTFQVLHVFYPGVKAEDWSSSTPVSACRRSKRPAARRASSTTAPRPSPRAVFPPFLAHPLRVGLGEHRAGSREEMFPPPARHSGRPGTDERNDSDLEFRPSPAGKRGAFPRDPTEDRSPAATCRSLIFPESGQVGRCRDDQTVAASSSCRGPKNSKCTWEPGMPQAKSWR